MEEKAKHKGGRAGSRIAITVLICVAVVLLLLGGYALVQLKKESDINRMMRQEVDRIEFYDGIIINGIDVSGKSKEEAYELVHRAIGDMDRKLSMEIKHGETSWKISGEDFTYAYNDREIVEEAYALGRDGTLDARYATVQGLKQEPRSFHTTWQPDRLRMDGHVLRIVQELSIPAEDAGVESFDPETKKFVLYAEKAGREVDEDKLRADIKERFVQRDMETPVEVETRVVQPSVKLADIDGKFRRLSSFSTTTTSNPARNENIRLASKAFHGTRVEPGEVFSINKATGERTVKKGYKPAGAIVNGKLEEEPGGGVCQVSTTLMNAIVRAGLEITDRGHHSWPSNYVDIGMDAAINYPDADFQFRNNSQGVVFLVSSFYNNELTIEVWGYPILAENERIELSSKLLSTEPAGDPILIEDKSLPVGTRITERSPHDGKRSETYLHLYRNGELVSTKTLFKDYYRPIRAKYRVGTRQVSGIDG